MSNCNNDVQANNACEHKCKCQQQNTNKVYLEIIKEDNFLLGIISSIQIYFRDRDICCSKLMLFSSLPNKKNHICQKPSR